MNAKAAFLIALAAFGGSLSSASAQEPIGVILPARITSPEARPAPPEPPEPCTQDCFVLSDLTLRGSASGPMTFELHGQVRAHGEIKIPLFGPPSQVRLDDVTIDGARATVTFDSEHYSVLTSAKSFTLRGRITPGNDQMLTIPGPIVTVDARLSKGRVVEGERLSGVLASVLHFDPMDETAASKPTAPLALHVSRALRFGKETKFVYRIVATQGSDIGSLRFPLRYGEKVGDVQGSKDWKVEGTDLVLPVEGQSGEITISGALADPKEPGVRSFRPDDRSPYEFWMVEADPEHLLATSGEVKAVELNQAQIPPTMPNARTFLVQRGQHLDVDARSLVRGDVLAAVARAHHRVVAITGSGELISDEKVQVDNNGLEHLLVMPAGKAMYLSIGGVPQHILHLQAGTPDIIVPMRPGSQVVRVQSRAEVGFFPLLGAVTVPGSTYALTTGATETVIGLPTGVHPIAVTGGDRLRTTFARGDFAAVALGIALACFGFRTRKTRVLGALATMGLWFVSKEAFVFASGGLFVLGAIFLASRFLRGTKLLVASGGILVAALVGGRMALAESAVPAEIEMLADRPALDQDSTYVTRDSANPDITPVSLSLPAADKYVKTTRQLVSKDRPFVPRVFYVTSTMIGVLHLAWIALVAALAWAHRSPILALKRLIVERLSRAPGELPKAAEEAPPF